MAEKLSVEYVDLLELVPYEKNPRRNDKAVTAVANSIERFGWKNPIIVDRDYVIISGHTRRLAAMKLGLDKVPVHVADDLTDEQVAAFRLADNRVAELAVWDEAALRQEIAEINGIDLEEFGFDKKMLDDVGSVSLGIKRHICPRCGAEWAERL